MGTWYNLLKICIGEKALEKYSEIFYLGTCSNLTKEPMNEKEVYDLLENCIADNKEDHMSFFIFTNSSANEKLIVIICDPFELFAPTYVYKVIDFNENANFENLPNYQKVK
jgi:hypothetical protein